MARTYTDEKRVVVTGLGVVAGPTSGANSLAETLRDSTLTCSEVDLSGGYHLPESARLAVLSRGLDLREWLSSAETRRMSPPSKLAVAAARMAVKDSRLDGAVSGP